MKLFEISKHVSYETDPERLKKLLSIKMDKHDALLSANPSSPELEVLKRDIAKLEDMIKLSVGNRENQRLGKSATKQHRRMTAYGLGGEKMHYSDEDKERVQRTLRSVRGEK